MFITRFAPSPTGHLHLGHLVSAMHVWGIAEKVAARVILRFEDHDRQRCKPEYESSILEDLNWLGFAPSKDDTGRPLITRQSDRDALYVANFKQLHTQGDLYACQCTRKDILSRLKTGPHHCEDIQYDNHCRTRELPMDAGLPIRIKTDESDFVIKDKLGNWTYQFAVVSDDLDQNINLIIRGEDILPSTPRQNFLRQRLGNSTLPIYVHHPLIYEDGTLEKLSKRHKSMTLKALKAQGATPEDLKMRYIDSVAHASNMCDAIDFEN